jgi:hypothetical protein
MRLHSLPLLTAMVAILGAAPALAEPEAQVPPPAETKAAPPAARTPDFTDGVMVWPWWHVAPDAAAGTAQARADLAVYYIKQYWLTPNSGIYTFYNTGQAAVLRYMQRWQLPADFQVTGMAGMRAIALGNNPPTPSLAFRTGPEVALSINHPLFWKVQGQVFGTYAALFPLNAAAIPAGTPSSPVHCVFYGFNLIAPVAERTSLSLGMQGQINAFFVEGLQFHNLGPTLSITHAF